MLRSPPQAWNGVFRGERQKKAAPRKVPLGQVVGWGQLKDDLKPLSILAFLLLTLIHTPTCTPHWLLLILNTEMALRLNPNRQGIHRDFWGLH